MSSSDNLPAGEPPATPTEMLLGEFLDAVLARQERGESIVVEEMLRDHPDLIERGRQIVQGLMAARPSAPVAVVATVYPPTLNEPPSAPCGSSVSPEPICGRYFRREVLGEGAFGKVWKADDMLLGRSVALKSLRVAAGTPEGSVALAALRREAGHLAQLSHPNVVQVYDWLEDGDEHYLVLEYVVGGSLADLLKREGPLPCQRAARYIADVAHGLLAVHARGIINRDIKPANILLDAERDEAKLTDFGVAARIAEARTITGTPLYMAPEAFAGQATASSDVYSLTVTLFHLTTGETPFRAETWNEQIALIGQGLPDPDPRCRVLPETLEGVIRAGLAADAAMRPTLKQFNEALRAALNHAEVDSLVPAGDKSRAAPPVDLRLVVSRREGAGWCPVATSKPHFDLLRRDIKRVPPKPEKAKVRTGEPLRIEVVADRPGYLAVLNVGSTGNLNLLYPVTDYGDAPWVEGRRPVRFDNVELTGEPGKERMFAIWSSQPLPLGPEQLQSLAEGDDPGSKKAYIASRDIVRVKQAVEGAAEVCRVVVLELEHEARP